MATLSKLCFGKVKALIWSEDHCEPHVHFVCDADDWELKVFFTFESNQQRPLKYDIIKKGRSGRPNSAQCKQALQNTWVHIADCKSIWWKNVEDICVKNKMGNIDPSNVFTFVSQQNHITKTLETGRVCSNGFTMIKPYGHSEIQVL